METAQATSAAGRPVYQPLHPDVRARLDPDYIQLHEDVLRYVPRSETLPWTADSRSAPSPMAHGGQKLSDVGSVEDRPLGVDGEVQARIFTPSGTPPPQGWPIFVWFHGGGWVVGGLASENGFLTHICKRTSSHPLFFSKSIFSLLTPRTDIHCVVISINYRHAPEHVYPTAADDSYAGLEWVLSADTIEQLHLDQSKVALGGLSAGGGLASIVGLKAADAAYATTVKPCFQMLICPVIDNTATVESAWAASQHSPWLTPTRMQWYRNKYFVGDAQKQTAEWTASPCFAPNELLARSPPTFLAIAGCDLLAPEATDFAEKLRVAGVPVDVQTYPGGTHSMLILAGIHQTGKKVVHDASAALARAFGTSYDAEAAPVLSLEA
ncbi:candidate lipase from carbohydrate esterase family ce10 [Grosmannia clavigera kw1407]|uniref:Candidate lipase from carbohydrate esterase family ce10 n=1 Tax=Grosmannia clavigera (strain kw1407 / UAMH 11150) TaxID=655863 RepID=F0XD77_GROCL|nr:putative lipase from carbohydrate esterase family ce10 [Grosmannia clavigera kw1407]EFX03757.1 candidate lipase from carbohydrate esterase family ce10 [Grosmannia clavigera kw1407]